MMKQSAKFFFSFCEQNWGDLSEKSFSNRAHRNQNQITEMTVVCSVQMNVVDLPLPEHLVFYGMSQRMGS